MFCFLLKSMSVKIERTKGKGRIEVIVTFGKRCPSERMTESCVGRESYAREDHAILKPSHGAMAVLQTRGSELIETGLE
jgi:hypothetical protein